MNAIAYPVDRFSLSYAALAAIIIECVLFALLVYVLAHRTEVIPGMHPAKIVLSFPVISRPQPPKPKVKKPVMKPRPHPKPIHHVVHHRHILKPPPPKPKPMTKPTPAPPKKAVTVPQPPPRPSVSPDAMSLFEEHIHESIQSALVYPYAARMAHISGRVKVAFNYRAGRVSDIRIVQDSPYAMLNTAAIQAVQNASYPTPPPNLGNRELQFEIWVQFKQVNSYAQ